MIYKKSPEVMEELQKKLRNIRYAALQKNRKTGKLEIKKLFVNKEIYEDWAGDVGDSFIFRAVLTKEEWKKKHRDFKTYIEKVPYFIFDGALIPCHIITAAEMRKFTSEDKDGNINFNINITSY